MKDGDYVSGFARGLKVIEAFAQSPRLNIADVAKLTGLDRATARRCLLTLSALGYAHHDGKYFSLTPKVLRLGHSYLAATPLARVVQPFLDRLAEEVGQSASVSVLEDTEIIYVARAAQKRVMSINLMPGSRLPAFCSSMGRVHLAALPEPKARDIIDRSVLQASTPYTKTDPGDLLRELGAVRAQGFAVVNQELELGLCSIAVPIVGPKHQVVAALNIGTAAVGSVADRLVDMFLRPLQETAAVISKHLH